jgi:hypothetical protein
MATVPTFTLYRTGERPDVRLWLVDESDALVDLSSGFTFEFKLGTVGSAATFTKTTGITGAVGAGVRPTGTPNLVMTFNAAELDGLTRGPTTGQIKATTGGKDRFWQCTVQVRDVIT